MTDPKATAPNNAGKKAKEQKPTAIKRPHPGETGNNKRPKGNKDQYIFEVIDERKKPFQLCIYVRDKRIKIAEGQFEAIVDGKSVEGELSYSRKSMWIPGNYRTGRWKFIYYKQTLSSENSLEGGNVKKKKKKMIFQ